MAVLPFQPTPFFANKNRAFWNLQFAGWGGAFLLRAMSALANSQSFDLLAVILVTTITGFSITLVLSVIYRQLINQRPLVMWTSAFLVLIGAVILHASIDAWVQGIYYAGTRETTFAQRFIGLSYIPLTLLGGWSALYFAINYFLTLEEQADRLERLEAQATSAQLAMLRYQLNPHFLFNTLNSISTLVLLKQTEPANAMLTRLSSFLRHTLVTQPGSQVTLAQEVETLQLYLEIERMRFEDRLRTEFAIDDAAMDATLPSMLLQPLIENAIKYAVSPQEEGAKITLTARVVGERLRISVEDTGPGLEGPEQGDLLALGAQSTNITSSTGVGLPNIRNRLAQAYGEDHRFETRSDPGGGFAVLIEIPFESASQDAPEESPEPPRQIETQKTPGNAGAGNTTPETAAPAPLARGRIIGSNA
ncbi:Histidine kinase-, DNA gyrase B-, and HSP90-like ATPase [Altererythrobacter xiamenensis]|uniref:histidine kinase n=1 Tax=Altererythrobacter xiamenensis TaxID=1316679 RepID=A0A1Y6F893_9SPHN|nr:sensor histidine kinase [Altererythrobacter xiamenensis]SMQ68912.1 Histidine kinase-, DNA gyrase B-, and HSP90-like ATPase [Altererythrobacter xiamenensis]